MWVAIDEEDNTTMLSARRLSHKGLKYYEYHPQDTASSRGCCVAESIEEYII